MYNEYMKFNNIVSFVEKIPPSGICRHGTSGIGAKHDWARSEDWRGFGANTGHGRVLEDHIMIYDRFYHLN
jgi:hypothetical protein